jgi:hypothetical protein
MSKVGICQIFWQKHPEGLFYSIAEDRSFLVAPDFPPDTDIQFGDASQSQSSQGWTEQKEQVCFALLF